MATEPPPFTDADPFQKYLRDSGFNTRATAANYPTVFTLLRDIDALAAKIEQAMAVEKGHHLLIARALFIRARSAYLAACRIALGAQGIEAAPAIRLVLESSWYALHIGMDPNPPTRLETWLKRADDAAAEKACRKEFTIANVRSSHEAINPTEAAEVAGTYDGLIDFGAHPNQLGVLASLGVPATDVNAKTRTYQVSILGGDPKGVAFALRYAAAAGIAMIRLVGHTFPGPFAAAEGAKALPGLIDRLNTVFKAFA